MSSKRWNYPIVILRSNKIVMSIEIKELHIRVGVNMVQSRQPPGSQVAAVGSSNTSGDDGRDAIVAECVEQVLQILQNRMER